MYRHFIWILMFSTIIIGCGEGEQRVKSIVENIQGQMDESAYLEKLNSRLQIYEGTETHKRLSALEPISKTFESRSDLYEVEGLDPTTIDSVRSWINDDTLQVVHMFHVSGSCVHMLPYLEIKDDVTTLYTPEVLSATVEIEEDGPAILTQGCALETVAALTYKIPLKRITGRVLVFNNKVIYSTEE